MYTVGIDGGSRAIKIVILDSATGQIVAAGSCDQGVDHNTLATALFERLLTQAHLERSQIARSIATGYTRNLITFADSTITEITCHAVGVKRQVPAVRTIIEIGGQDSKLLRLEATGTVRDFAMNDRCAAGTGRFLEVVAQRLDTHLTELGVLARESRQPAPISSTCVVFAETEIIGLLASGTPRQDIIAGVQHAIASRVAAMAGRDLVQPIVFTGGVAMVPGMREALQSVLNKPVELAPDPQITGALGAAILAAKEVSK